MDHTDRYGVEGNPLSVAARVCWNGLAVLHRRGTFWDQLWWGVPVAGALTLVLAGARLAEWLLDRLVT